MRKIENEPSPIYATIRFPAADMGGEVAVFHSLFIRHLYHLNGG